MAGDGLKSLTLPLPMLSHVINLLSLPPSPLLSLYFTYRGKWTDLTSGIPGVWVWDLKTLISIESRLMIARGW
jgi:hypothetical protein